MWLAQAKMKYFFCVICKVKLIWKIGEKKKNFILNVGQTQLGPLFGIEIERTYPYTLVAKAMTYNFLQKSKIHTKKVEILKCLLKNFFGFSREIFQAEKENESVNKNSWPKARL